MQRFYGGFIDGRLDARPPAVFTSRRAAAKQYEDVRELCIYPIAKKLSVPGGRTPSSGTIAPRGPGRRKNRGKKL